MNGHLRSEKEKTSKELAFAVYCQSRDPSSRHGIQRKESPRVLNPGVMNDGLLRKTLCRKAIRNGRKGRSWSLSGRAR